MSEIEKTLDTPEAEPDEKVIYDAQHVYEQLEAFLVAYAVHRRQAKRRRLP